MNHQRPANLVRSLPSFRALSRATLAAALCGLLAGQPVVAQPTENGTTSEKTPAGSASAAAQVQGQARVLHALNRLTFGPRPGDVAAVQAMGFDKWFETQLHPAQIDDAQLDQRLAQFPAMNMTIPQLSEHYPGPAQVRGMAAGKLSLPSDPVARVLAKDEIAFYREKNDDRKKSKQAGEGKAEPGDPAMMAAAGAPLPEAQAEAAGQSDQAMAVKPIPAADLAPVGVEDTATEGKRAEVRALVEHLASLAPDDRMKAILALPPDELKGLRGALNPRQLQGLGEGLSPVQKETLAAIPGSLRMIGGETLQSRLLRDIYSNRQLEAVMTDFWLNHFNVYIRKSQLEPYLIPTYERETIRAHALGNFEELLVATAESPAMLVYLDNWRSIGPDSMQATRIKQASMLRPNGKIAKASAGLNENYGRELMELHTLGVNGGYTQADVTQVAKVFTGWTLDRPYQDGGQATFNERQHEPGAKTVLGKTIHENGGKEGMEVLHLLATSPATAHFISQKLAVRFVADDPPAALVDRMAATFITTHGDIKSVLRTMVYSPEFFASPAVHAKVKTPLEFVVSAARAANAEVNNAQSLAAALDKLGMPLYGMQTPQGYSWKQEEWVGTGALVSRLNFALVLSGNKLPGVRTEWAALPGASPQVLPASFDAEKPSDLTGKERKLEAMLLGGPVSERTRATVLAQANDTNVAAQAATQFDLSNAGAGKKAGKYTPRGNAGTAGSPDDPQAAVMAGMLLGSPEFQRR